MAIGVIHLDNRAQEDREIYDYEIRTWEFMDEEAVLRFELEGSDDEGNELIGSCELERRRSGAYEGHLTYTSINCNGRAKLEASLKRDDGQLVLKGIWKEPRIPAYHMEIRIEDR